MDWTAELEIRKTAPIGTLFFMGMCNFGKDESVLPLVRRTKTQLVCSDGKRTERIMIVTGAVVGRVCGRAQHRSA